MIIYIVIILLVILTAYLGNYSVKKYLQKGRNLAFLFYMLFLGVFLYQVGLLIKTVIELAKTAI